MLRLPAISRRTDDYRGFYLYATINGASIFFDVAGSQLRLGDDRMEERPTLIALHGGPGVDHAPMRPYFDRFANTHHVVYLDQRGHGRSSSEPETWTLAQWGTDIKAFCDHLGIVRPIVLGVSFGGMVAMSYAAQFPDHPANLVLSSTAAKLRLEVTYAMLESKGGLRARNIAERMFEHGDETAMEEYRAVCLPLYNPKPDPDPSTRKRAIIRNEIARQFFLGEMRSMDLREGLRRIQCPTLVLAGAHDPITPPVCSEEIAAHIPRGLAQLAVFDAAGHGVHRDDPGGAERVIRAFLEA